MGNCEADGCNGHADATAYYADDEREEQFCWDHALKEQMKGTPPTAIKWSAGVSVEFPD